MPQVLGAQPLGEVGVMLGLTGQGAENGSGVRPGQKTGQRAQVGAEIAG
jgi:hypothetical protein